MFRFIAFLILAAAFPAAAAAEPVEVSSPDLRPVPVDAQRALGRLVIYANFSSHRIMVDGGELPVYLADRGIDITSNEIHEIVVKNEGGAEKTYRISVNPGQTLALYVDLGKDKADKKNDKKEKDTKKKKDDAAVGFLTVKAESEAQVYIDGKLVSSKTPLNRHEVTPGSHKVSVYFLSTRKFSRSREVYVGKGVSMSVNFEEN